MSATTALMTVEEFLQLPETGPFYYELRHGELAQATRPNKKHDVIQQRVEEFLKEHSHGAFWVRYEMAFRALPEYELRVADVGAVTMAVGSGPFVRPAPASWGDRTAAFAAVLYEAARR